MNTYLRKLWLSFKEMTEIPMSRQKQEGSGSSLYANSFFLMANSAATNLLGFLFWVVVARFYAADDLGVGSALISVGALLSFIATLGLGTGLIRYLSGARSNASALINSCFTLSSLVALVVAIIFIAGIPLWSPALNLIRGNLLFGGSFVAFIILGTLFSLLSETYIALRRAEFSLIHGSLMGLLKLILVVSLASLFGVFSILAAWTLATAVTIGLGVLLFLTRLQPGYWPMPSLRRQVSNEMVHFSFANYISKGLLYAPGWILPVMVVSLLGGQTNAYFFVSWAMAGLLFAIPLEISTSLFAEGSYQDTHLVRDIKRSFKLILVLILPATVLLVVAGDKLLLVFGREYSQEGARLLWVLAPSVLPLSLNAVYLAIAKVKKRLKDVIIIAVAIAVGTLGLGYILIPHLGILGPAVSWIISQSLVALVVLPRFIKILRSAKAKVSGDY